MLMLAMMRHIRVRRLRNHLPFLLPCNLGLPRCVVVKKGSKFCFTPLLTENRLTLACYVV